MRYVALLRGLNVGRGNRVSMAELRSLMEKLGFRDVVTLLNSGNVVFEAPSKPVAAHAGAIRMALAKELDVDVLVVVKTAKDLEAATRENPLTKVATHPSLLLVTFTENGTTLRSLASISTLVVPPEAFHLGKHAAYLWCPKGSLACKAGEALLGKAGREATTRNWATFGKILALLRAKPGK